MSVYMITGAAIRNRFIACVGSQLMADKVVAQLKKEDPGREFYIQYVPIYQSLDDVFHALGLNNNHQAQG